ncbi:hypothetical protein CC80DRAFT_543366 [Byssothecium circinans]|uniref:Uncharacterized protein n=1 Tax=Byssothecium circinans TaxID=147558 RepID=A0A6A5UDH3_9PLEO|nr:hypothetical protein CC80DRAFT_543366 [Byssothecium circinans]
MKPCTTHPRTGTLHPRLPKHHRSSIEATLSPRTARLALLRDKLQPAKCNKKRQMLRDGLLSRVEEFSYVLREAKAVERSVLAPRDTARVRKLGKWMGGVAAGRQRGGMKVRRGMMVGREGRGIARGVRVGGEEGGKWVVGGGVERSSRLGVVDCDEEGGEEGTAGMEMMEKEKRFWGGYQILKTSLEG